MQRRTLAGSVLIEGIGIHRGEQTSVRIGPGESGIVFVKDGKSIPAILDNVVDTRLSTTIGKDGVIIATIEHLMSCLWGLSITDCEVRILGEEIPVIDGSARPFYTRISEAGFTDLQGETKAIVVREPVRAEEGGSWIEALPGEFSITYDVEYPTEAIGRQCLIYDGRDYGAEIAPARTFGMLKDVEMMRAAGLALGGSLENAVVVDEKKVLNPEGLRFPDEFVRHKILDLLGDLWMLGAPLKGEIRACKASHRLHIALANKIRAAYS